MTRLIQITNVVPDPDGLFYYTLSMLLAGALVWVIQRYVSRVQKTLDVLSGKVQRLEVNDGKQDEKIIGLQNKVFVVKHRVDQ